jgi:hypothetical protein
MQMAGQCLCRRWARSYANPGSICPSHEEGLSIRHCGWCVKHAK